MAFRGAILRLLTLSSIAATSLSACSDGDNSDDGGGGTGGDSAATGGSPGTGGSSGSGGGSSASGGTSGAGAGGTSGAGGSSGSGGGGTGGSGGVSGAAGASGSAGASGAGGDGMAGSAGDAGAGPTLTIQSTSLGNVLATADGFTLYVSTDDIPGTGSMDPVVLCQGPCAMPWPAYHADPIRVSDRLTASDFTNFTGQSSMPQTAYKGQPLYRFSPDLAPGETKGEGVVGKWSAVRLPTVM